MFEDFLLILQGIGAVLIVCGVAYLVIRFGLRPVYRGGAAGNIKVVERIPLDSRGSSSLLLVKVGDKVLLLGMSQGGISLLREFPPYELGDLEQGQLSERALENINFSKIYRRLTGKDQAEAAGDEETIYQEKERG